MSERDKLCHGSNSTLIGGIDGHVTCPQGEYTIFVASLPWLLGRNSLKLAKMSTSETINSSKEKLDNWLHEKNYFTDALDKVEKKTGVKRIYIFLGNFIKYATQFEWTFGSNYKLGVLVSSSFRTHWNIRSLSCVRLWSRSDCDNTGFCLSCLSIVSIFQIAN